MDNFINLLGLIAGLLCAASFLPQLIKIRKTKNTTDLSLPTFIIFCLGVSIWLIYGILKKDGPIIFANIVTLTIAVNVLLLKLKYK